jgi:hypothetical protein
MACLGGKKDIERAPPTLVRLKECYVAEHLCGLITFRQSSRPFDPQPEVPGELSKAFFRPHAWHAIMAQGAIIALAAMAYAARGASRQA